jgi:glucokinase
VTFVLGIDFGGTKIALATAGVTGEPLRRVQLETRGREGAGEVLRRTVTAARRVATGVSTFGVVRDGRVMLAPNVPGWEDLPLPALLREELATPSLRMDNDVNAATAAEARWGRLAGVGLGIYVNIGTGLGAGIVLGGRVLPGTHGAAGEIGYWLRSPGQAGYADGRAPLEEYVSGSGLARRGARLLGRDVGADELFANRGDARVAALLDDAADTLGMAIGNLAIALDPECVVIGGGIAAENSMLPRLAALIRRAVPFPPRVEIARFVNDAALVGALALAVDAATSLS